VWGTKGKEVLPRFSFLFIAFPSPSLFFGSKQAYSMIPGPLPWVTGLGCLFLASPAASAFIERAVADKSSDGWTLSTTELNTTAFESEPYVANGYIGARLPVEGMGLKVFPAINYTAENGTQGWPLFSLRQTASIVAGFYDQQGPTRGTNFVSILK
jgi:hypothetical protein